jgi:hypothetical protein
VSDHLIFLKRSMMVALVLLWGVSAACVLAAWLTWSPWGSLAYALPLGAVCVGCSIIYARLWR